MTRIAHLVVALVASLTACTVGGGTNDDLSGSAGATAQGTTGASLTSASGIDDTTTADNGHADTDATAGSSPTTAGTSTGAADETTTSDATSTTADIDTTATTEDASSSGGTPDLEDGILDVTIIAHDDCTITTMPASISVPEGTAFTVNWISSAASETTVDVAKIDQFNQVPIIIGMEPASSYHDEVREWCGALFTGTFDFRITSCFDPQYIPVDCAGI